MQTSSFAMETANREKLTVGVFDQQIAYFAADTTTREVTHRSTDQQTITIETITIKAIDQQTTSLAMETTAQEIVTATFNSLQHHRIQQKHQIQKVKQLRYKIRKRHLFQQI